MKREVHAECHYEKGSEGSRKGEIYARGHAKFRHILVRARRQREVVKIKKKIVEAQALYR